MGGGVSRAEKRRKEAHRHSLLRDVERFVVNVYATGPRIEAVRLLLGSEMASKAFSQFVSSENADDTYSMYVVAMSLVTDRMTNYALSVGTENLIKTFIIDSANRQVIVSKSVLQQALDILSADKDDANYISNVKSTIWVIAEEGLFLMARDHFQRFLTSKYYKHWRAAESSHAIAHTEEEHKEVIASSKAVPKAKPRASNKSSVAALLAITPRKDPKSKSISDPMKRKRKEELSFSAFTNVDAHELGKVLGAESWLAALISAAEGLPVCFSLSTARRDRRGFPLMYVNRFFEKVTGYSRKDVVGKNCRFLQCPFSERESIQTLSDALRSAMRAQVVITNARYDGTIYKNLVSIKPIFNESRQYCYVMAIHIDVTKEVDLYMSKGKLATELMDMLPDTLLNDVEDESLFSSCLPR